jgi:hypothetical protein
MLCVEKSTQVFRRFLSCQLYCPVHSLSVEVLHTLSAIEGKIMY